VSDMECGIVAVPGCFDSGLTGLLDVLRWAEFVRPGVGADIPPLHTTVLTLGDGPVRTAGGLTVAGDQRPDATVLAGLDVPVVPAGAAMAHLDLALELVLGVSAQLARTTADMLLVDLRPARSIMGATHYLGRSDELVEKFEMYARANLEKPFTIDDAASAIGT